MHKNTQRILSKTLFDLRKKSKLTQKAIADVMGISVAMYSKIELGERTVQEKHILKLAHLLNIDVTEFKILCLADKLYSEVIILGIWLTRHFIWYITNTINNKNEKEIYIY